MSDMSSTYLQARVSGYRRVYSRMRKRFLMLIGIAFLLLLICVSDWMSVCHQLSVWSLTVAFLVSGILVWMVCNLYVICNEVLRFRELVRLGDLFLNAKTEEETLRISKQLDDYLEKAIASVKSKH